MIHRLALKLVNWSAAHIEDDSEYGFDDFRRLVQHREALRRRVDRMRMVAIGRQVKQKPRQAEKAA